MDKVPGSIYLRNGRYYWMVALPGERRRSIPLRPRGAKFATRDERVAIEIAKQLWREAAEKPKGHIKKCRTVSDLVAAYTRYADGYYNSREPENIRYALRILLQEAPRMPVDDLGPLELEEIRDKMIARGWTIGVINQRVNIIRRMYKWAASKKKASIETYRELLSLENLRKGFTKARDTRKIGPADPESVEAALSRLHEPVQSMVRIQAITGMRSTELCVMRPCDIDRTQEVWVYVPSQFKGQNITDRPRKIPIGPQAQAVLRPFLLRNADEYCFRPAEGDKADKSIQYNPCYNRYSYRRAIKRAIEAAFPPPAHLAPRPGESKTKWRERLTNHEKAELKAWYKQFHWYPHQLRHSAGTRIRKEFGAEAAQAALGHARLSTTEIYAEVNFQLAIDVMKKIG